MQIRTKRKNECLSIGSRAASSYGEPHLKIGRYKTTTGSECPNPSSFRVADDPLGAPSSDFPKTIWGLLSTSTAQATTIDTDEQRVESQDYQTPEEWFPRWNKNRREHRKNDVGRHPRSARTRWGIGQIQGIKVPLRLDSSPEADGASGSADNQSPRC